MGGEVFESHNMRFFFHPGLKTSQMVTDIFQKMEPEIPNRKDRGKPL